MNDLLRSIKKNKMTLIVSLPSNSKALAKAAAKGGADALKVHMNVKHEASGVVFGGYDDEKDAIGEVIDSVKIPVGIMPGNEELPSEKEMGALKKIGI